MKKEEALRPTQAELAILAVLWERGPSMVPEIWETLKDERGTVYTTVLKQLQVMEEKGLVTAEKKRRPYLYTANASQEHTQRRLLGELLENAFGGSLLKLVLNALTSRKASREELAEIRALLDSLERRK